MAKCGCNYSQKVCLTPGVDAALLVNASHGKVCIGRTTYGFNFVLPAGADGTNEPSPGDPNALYMSLWEPFRLKCFWFDFLFDVGGAVVLNANVTVDGIWFRTDNWLPSPSNDNDGGGSPTLNRGGIRIGAFDCERYVKCWGCPLPTQCLPTGHAQNDALRATFSNGTGVDVVLPGHAIVDHGMVPMAVGECYMETGFEAQPGSMNGSFGAMPGAAAVPGFEQMPNGSGGVDLITTLGGKPVRIPTTPYVP